MPEKIRNFRIFYPDAIIRDSVNEKFPKLEDARRFTTHRRALCLRHARCKCCLAGIKFVHWSAKSVRRIPLAECRGACYNVINK